MRNLEEEPNEEKCYQFNAFQEISELEREIL